MQLLLDQAADRAADEVQLGLLDRVTTADFATAASAERIEDLAGRLDPVMERLRNSNSGILRVNVIARDGTILYSDLQAARGRMIPLKDRPELETALSGGIGADETALNGEENSDLHAQYARALEVYVPVRLAGSVVGAYEIYEDVGRLRIARSVVWVVLLLAWGIAGVTALGVRQLARTQSHAEPVSTARPDLRSVDADSSARANAQRNVRVRLTRRELEVLRLMATSHSNGDIAEQLGVSQETVRTHVKRILHKLEQPDRTQAVLAAMRAGLLESP